jgi:hypothetical protein
MGQFDVYANPNPDTNHAVPYQERHDLTGVGIASVHPIAPSFVTVATG